ncbi:MAG: peptide chain release factor-like protein [Planctomycetes bacterium]|nr:peptide chain release factor-like protein [Planctomycetota bacterium]
MDAPVVHPAALDESALLADCTVRRGRRSGPGGQHRNKVETAVVIEHGPSGIRAEASERRSQEENRRVAVFRLRVKLALGVRTPVGKTHTSSELWQSRCRHGKIRVAATHRDFPAVLAEAIAAIDCEDMDVSAAAKQLGCSTSQLTKLLKVEPRALAQINAARKARGLRKLQ